MYISEATELTTMGLSHAYRRREITYIKVTYWKIDILTPINQYSRYK